MDHPQGVLRTGDRATVTFEFISRPEFLKEGMKLLFREGKTKVRSLSLYLSLCPSVSLSLSLSLSVCLSVCLYLCFSRERFADGDCAQGLGVVTKLL